MKRRDFLMTSLTAALAGIGSYTLATHAQPAANRSARSLSGRSGRCRILAIDGGGIRGIIPAYILKQLEAALGKPIYQCFDVIAGTSTGGLITLGLTTPTAKGQPPYTADEILDFYLKERDDIFVYQSTGLFNEAEYYGTSPKKTGIQPWLRSKFPPNLTLAQARQQLQSLGKPIPEQVLVTSYTMDGARGIPIGPYLFNWVDARKSNADNYCVWEAARSTSAAPTYFPIARVGAGAPGGSNATSRWAVDGGVAANDPALYALASAAELDLFNGLSNVLLVSLGTGSFDTPFVITDQGDWGALNWFRGSRETRATTSSIPLLDVLFDATVQVPQQQLTALIPKNNFYRLEPRLPTPIPLDGTDTQAVLKIAQRYISPSGEGYRKFQSLVDRLS